MKITKARLRKMILEELRIVISRGGGIEEVTGVSTDVDTGDVSQTPLPADFGSQEDGGNEEGGMDSIAEGWEDEDPHNAPPAGRIPLRPRRLEVDEVIDDVIVSLESAPEQMAKEDVISLLQHIANIYLGS